MRQDRQIHFNRLLDYRPLEQLSSMTDGDRAVLLAEILRNVPSEASWQALWELFASWPSGESKANHLDVAEQALATWADRLRFAFSSNRLLYDGERLSTLARLVRSIEIYRREEHGPAELLAIASSEYSAGLTYLSVVRSEIAARAWQVLVESPYLSNLRHLHVSKAVLGATDIQRLFQSSRLMRLRCLKLIDVGIQPRDLEGVRQAIPFAELCAIDLSFNGLGDEGAILLSQAVWLQQIRRMALSHNHIGAEAMRALLSSPFCERLEQIDLSGNRVTDPEKPGLMALAAMKQLQLIV